MKKYRSLIKHPTNLVNVICNAYNISRKELAAELDYGRDTIAGWACEEGKRHITKSAKNHLRLYMKCRELEREVEELRGRYEPYFIYIDELVAFKTLEQGLDILADDRIRYTTTPMPKKQHPLILQPLEKLSNTHRAEEVYFCGEYHILVILDKKKKTIRTMKSARSFI
jgi:hypothetical protein